MEESKFTGGFWGSIWRSWVASLGSIIPFLGPWVFVWLFKWVKRNTYINGMQQKFVGSGLGLLGHIFLWALLFITIIGGLFVPVLVLRWITKNTVFETETKE